jgi:hypothetical protein
LQGNGNIVQYETFVLKVKGILIFSQQDVVIEKHMSVNRRAEFQVK